MSLDPKILKMRISELEKKLAEKDKEIAGLKEHYDATIEELKQPNNEIIFRQEELKEGQNKYKSIIEHSTNLFYQHDTNHKLTFLSPQIKDILGYTPEEAKVKWTQLASDNPMNEIGFEKTMKAIETGKRQPTYELELIHKNGHKVMVEVREAPLLKNGKTIAIIGSLNDITKRKNAERAKQISRNRSGALHLKKAH